MSDMPKQFWMVYGLGMGPPTFEHDSRESAVAEAKRLARKMPDCIFVVLEAVESFEKREFHTVNYRANTDARYPDDGIPF